MSENDVVYRIEIQLTRNDLENLLEVLNRYEFDDNPLTVEEVLSKPDLLKYICEMDFKECTLIDPLEYWNNDGWCDVHNYR